MPCVTTVKSSIMSNLTRDRSLLFLGLFVVFALANLIAMLTISPYDNYLTKPFLMVWLAAYIYVRLQPVTVNSVKYLLLGLVFSCLGDTLLLFADGRPAGELFFLLGLGSFLLTHIAYWLAFHYWPGNQEGWLSRRPLLILPFLLYWIAVIWLLWPLPEGLQIPVLIYSMVIMLMAVKALDIGPRLSPKDHLMLLIGAMLFILSDSIIALSRFTDLLPRSTVFTGWAIMITYLSGQLLIVLAFRPKTFLS